MRVGLACGNDLACSHLIRAVDGFVGTRLAVGGPSDLQAGKPLQHTVHRHFLHWKSPEARCTRNTMTLLKNGGAVSLLFLSWATLNLIYFATSCGKGFNALPSSSVQEAAIHIATGADQAFFPALTNFVGSVRYWCPECSLAVYNLGLTEAQKATVRGWCNTTLVWPNGILDSGYSNAHLFQAKKYAW